MRFPSSVIIIRLIKLSFEYSALSSDWYLNSLKSSYQMTGNECEAVQYKFSKFLGEWIASWFFLSDGAYLILVCCIVDKPETNKPHVRNWWFKMATSYPSHPIYIYIYIYIYIERERERERVWERKWTRVSWERKRDWEWLERKWEKDRMREGEGEEAKRKRERDSDRDRMRERAREILGRTRTVEKEKEKMKERVYMHVNTITQAHMYTYIHIYIYIYIYI